MPSAPRILDAPISVNELLFNDALRRAVLFEGLKKTEAARVVDYANRYIFPGVLDHVERVALDVQGLTPVERLVPSRIRAAKDLDAYLASTVAEQYKGLALSQKERLADIGLAEAQFQVDSLRTHVPGTFGLSMKAPSVTAIRGIISGVPVDGKRIGQWYEDLAPALRDRVNRTLHSGILNGDSTDQLIRRVRGTAARDWKDGALQLSRQQAAVVTRTTMTHVSAQARELTARENASVIAGVQWVSTLDSRTTDICFLGPTRVTPIGSVKRLFSRPYDGEVLFVRTASGKEMAVTPNHPILASGRWLPAKELKPGEHVLYSVSGDGLCVECRESVGMPPTLAEIADALRQVPGVKARRKRAAPEDFHGDGKGTDAEVDIVDVDRHLRDGIEAVLAERGENDLLGLVGLPTALSAGRALPCDLYGNGRVDVAAKVTAMAVEDLVDGGLAAPESDDDLSRSRSIVVGVHDRLDLVARDGHRLAARGLLHDAKRDQVVRDGGRGHTELPCDRCGALAVTVQADHVVDVRSELRRTHVYNLETESGAYLAGSVTVANCIALDQQVFEIDKGPRPPGHHQCRSVSVFLTKSWEELGIKSKADTTPAERASMNGTVPAKTTYSQWLRKQPKDFQDVVLGPGRAKLWRANKIKLEQLVTADLRPRTLDELRRLKPGATKFPGLLQSKQPPALKRRKPRPAPAAIPSPATPPPAPAPTPAPTPVAPRSASLRDAPALENAEHASRLESRLRAWESRLARAADSDAEWAALDKGALREEWARFADRETQILMRGDTGLIREKLQYLTGDDLYGIEGRDAMRAWIRERFDDQFERATANWSKLDRKPFMAGRDVSGKMLAPWRRDAIEAVRQEGLAERIRLPTAARVSEGPMAADYGGAIERAKKELAEHGIGRHTAMYASDEAQARVLEVLRALNGDPGVDEALEQWLKSSAASATKAAPGNLNTQEAFGKLRDVMRSSDRRLFQDPRLRSIQVRHEYGRAYADGAENLLNFHPESSRAASLTHEFAHHLEYRNSAVGERCRQWRNARLQASDPTFDEAVWRARALTDEAVPKDRFYTDYVGRVYGHEEATEVFSMGIEAFTGAERMREVGQDFDHFALIWSILRGY